MTLNKSSLATLLIIVLLAANLGLTAYVAFREQPSIPQDGESPAATTEVSATEAKNLAKNVAALYNANDIPGLYDRFDELAKVQMTQDQLAEQLGQLVALIGKVDDIAYSHATVVGKEGGRSFYKLSYKVRLVDGPFTQGDMTLTVARNEQGLGLYGFFINGSNAKPAQ